jgi:hypothetical protein
MTFSFPIPERAEVAEGAQDCAQTAAIAPERAEAAGARRGDTTSGRLAAGPTPTGTDCECAAASARASHGVPKTYRELGMAILEACDPVALGCEILLSKDDRSATTKLRALEMFAEWAYSKPEEDNTPMNLIWDLPLRRRASQPGEAGAENTTGGAK